MTSSAVALRAAIGTLGKTYPRRSASPRGRSARPAAPQSPLPGRGGSLRTRTRPRAPAGWQPSPPSVPGRAGVFEPEPRNPGSVRTARSCAIRRASCRGGKGLPAAARSSIAQGAGGPPAPSRPVRPGTAICGRHRGCCRQWRARSAPSSWARPGTRSPGAPKRDAPHLSSGSGPPVPPCRAP